MECECEDCTTDRDPTMMWGWVFVFVFTVLMGCAIWAAIQVMRWCGV